MDFRFLRPQTLRTLGVLCALAGGPVRVLADDWLQDGREPPPHPTVITTEYEGKTYNVMGASAEFASIEISGRKKRLYGSLHYQPERAAAYAAGFIRFESQGSSAEIRTNQQLFHGEGNYDVPKIFKGGLTSAQGEYHCTISSTESHTDCFLAVVFFCRGNDGNPDMATSAIAFREIGSLEPGKITGINIHGGYVPHTGIRYFCFPMIFSRGVEIRTDQSPIADRFFRQQEMVAHERILERYRQKFPTADHPPVAYLRVALALPHGMDKRTLPPALKAKFAVTESGEVDAVSLNEGLDPKAERALSRALQGWLFLPQLKQGYPARTRMEMPLSFD